MIETPAASGSHPVRVLSFDPSLGGATVEWARNAFGAGLSPIELVDSSADGLNTPLIVVYPALRPYLSRALQADIKPSAAVAAWQAQVAFALEAITAQPGLCFTVPDDRLLTAPAEVAAALSAWIGVAVVAEAQVAFAHPPIADDPVLAVIMRQSYEAAREGRQQEMTLAASGLAPAGVARPKASDVDALAAAVQSGRAAAQRLAGVEAQLAQELEAANSLRAALGTAEAERERLARERGGFLDLLKTAEVALAAAAEGRATLSAQVEANQTAVAERAALSESNRAQAAQIASLQEALEEARQTRTGPQKDARTIAKLRKRNRAQGATLTKRNAELESLRTSLEEMVSSEDKLRRALDEIRKDSLRLERQARAAEIRAEEIERSTSWRVTRPLRAFRRALKPSRSDDA